MRRCDEAVQSALQRQEAANKSLEEAQAELASLKEVAAGSASNEVDSRAVVAEARALLQVLEISPLGARMANGVVPDRLVAQMRKLRQTLLEDDEGNDEEVEDVEHDDTDDEFEDRRKGSFTLRSKSQKRARSVGLVGRRRALSASRTPPPDSASRRR